MSIRIGSDVNRFKDIIKGKVKNDLKRFASSGTIIGQQGAKSIKIPIHTIDTPRFRFGSKDMGGTGQGNGKPGDGIGDGKGKKPGQGQEAGDETGEHDLSAEFSPEELAKIVMDELELPLLEDKGKGKIHSEKNKYNKIGHQGSESLRHNKRTYKEAMKRQISSGSYNPLDPRIIPIKSDKRYRAASTIESPDINTVVINIIDISGSMGDEQRHLAKAMVFWSDLLLNASYKGIENVFICHDTDAKEVEREDFFKISSGGGTKISSAYKLSAEILQKEYPFSEWNSYVFHFSDGDNYSNEDNVLCSKVLNDNILPNTNMFAYGQIKSYAGSGAFIEHLHQDFGGNDKVALSKIDSEGDIFATIKAFFGKGK